VSPAGRPPPAATRRGGPDHSERISPVVWFPNLGGGGLLRRTPAQVFRGAL